MKYSLRLFFNSGIKLVSVINLCAQDHSQTKLKALSCYGARSNIQWNNI